MRKHEDLAKASPRAWRWLILLILFFGVIGYFLWKQISSSASKENHAMHFAAVFDHANLAMFHTPSPEATHCFQCHRSEFDAWSSSQHARANRTLNSDQDDPAFKKELKIRLGDSIIEISHSNSQKNQISWISANKQPEFYAPEMVIGVTPLWQYLIRFPGERWQVFPLAWDPNKKEWFHVFGNENRKEHEWGFWKNRGLNWNSQCASCHMTGFQKNYDAANDAYCSTWQTMGISCAQCHGNLQNHSQVSAKDKFNSEQQQESCASCHSRREELTGNFQPGEKFFDHYRLTLANSTEAFFPDGQVRQENFEYGSFLLSRMGHKGVTCLDCHDPHSGKLKMPAQDNSLCLSCHQTPGQRGAIPIEPSPHSHHLLNSTGNRCIECHMPTSIYMARDERRDHGFTIPDPLLTKELGIPNACNRCHTDQSTEWAIKWTERWYGNKMNRRSRKRARIIAGAQSENINSLKPLLDLVESEEIPAWRASLIALLKPWARQPEVKSLLLKSLHDDSPLVRASAIRSLEELPESPDFVFAWRRDPIRLVRLDADWVWTTQRQVSETEIKELIDYLNFNADQPTGAIKKAQYAMHRGNFNEAENWLKKTASWDPESAYVHYLLARTLNFAGKNSEAEIAFQQAIKLNPKNALYLYSQALLLYELGRKDSAIKALESTVQLDPHFARAWYNLGLAYLQQGQKTKARTALEKALENDSHLLSAREVLQKLEK